MPKPRITIRENVGPLHIENPNYVPAKGHYWNPETGFGGQPAPPAPNVQEERAERAFNDAILREYDIAHYLRSNPGEAEAVANAVAQLRAAGKSPEVAVAEVVGLVRGSVPEFAKRPADEGVWRANQEVARLQALRPKGIV